MSYDEHTIHVIPLGDLREHFDSPSCWCAPTRDRREPRLWVHHSADMREYSEGGRLPRERPRA